MSPRRVHFEEHASRLADCATLEVSEESGAVTVRLRPHHESAVGVVLYLGPGDFGTVAFDDPASVPAELGDDLDLDVRAIGHFVEAAVEGRVTAFRFGRGGCVEERNGDVITRSFMNASPLPGWRRRAEKVEYGPYR